MPKSQPLTLTGAFVLEKDIHKVMRLESLYNLRVDRHGDDYHVTVLGRK